MEKRYVTWKISSIPIVCSRAEISCPTIVGPAVINCSRRSVAANSSASRPVAAHRRSRGVTHGSTTDVLSITASVVVATAEVTSAAEVAATAVVVCVAATTAGRPVVTDVMNREHCSFPLQNGTKNIKTGTLHCFLPSDIESQLGFRVTLKLLTIVSHLIQTCYFVFLFSYFILPQYSERRFASTYRK